MVKISALPPMTSPDGDDEAPIVDDSVGSTKKFTLTLLKEWLQSLVGWITTAMIGADQVTATKIDWAATGADAGIWWEELGRTTLGSAGDTISVTGLPARKYLRIQGLSLNSGQNDTFLRFNNDSGSNYSYDASVSVTFIALDSGTPSNPIFFTADIINVSNQEKLVGYRTITRGAAGAGTAPVDRNAIGKWANTADAISRVDWVNNGTGDFAIGSELVVLGHN
jgi:hypothetical protein